MGYHTVSRDNTDHDHSPQLQEAQEPRHGPSRPCGPRHHHGLRRQHRPQRSTWPLVVAKGVIFEIFIFTWTCLGSICATQKLCRPVACCHKKIAFFSLHPPDTVIIYYNNMKKIDMNHKALLFNLCLFSGTKETFQVTGFLWWNKAQGSLKCVALGTQVSMPGEPLFSRWQLVSKVLLWVCDLWNSVSLCPSSFLLAMTLSSDGCSQEAGNCYKVCIQTVITNA